MAITRPVSKTIISTAGWGVPITDEVNRLTGLVDGALPGAWANPSWTNGYSHQASMRPVTYRKQGDWVTVIGVASGPANNGYTESIAWTFPTGYRPIANVYGVIASWTGTTWQTGRATIMWDGRVSLEFHNGQFVALNFGFPTT